MLFTNKQIESLRETVGFFHLTYIVENVGAEVLTKADLRLLQKYNYKIPKQTKLDYITESYLFGKLESTVKDANKLKYLSLQQFRNFIKKNPELVKFTKQDIANIHAAKQHIYNDIMRYSDNIKADFHQYLIDLSKQYAGKENLKSTPKNIISAVNKKLTEINKNYGNKFAGVTGYNLHSTFQQGIAAHLKDQKGENVRVYFVVHPDACEYCVKTYLRNGRGSAPKVFYLKNIIANGNNIGRKAKFYKPSISPLHPHCRCKMQYYPGINSKWSPRQNRYISVNK